MYLGEGAEKDPSAWATAHTWETEKKLLSVAWPSTSHCEHLKSEPMDKGSVSPLFLSLIMLKRSLKKNANADGDTQVLLKHVHLPQRGNKSHEGLQPCTILSTSQ